MAPASPTTSPPPRSAARHAPRCLPASTRTTTASPPTTSATPGWSSEGTCFPSGFERAGYWTIHVGKFLSGYQRSVEPDSVVAPGWDEWHTVLGNTSLLRLRPVRQRAASSITEAGAATTSQRVLNRRAVRMVDKYAPKGHPFYLQLDQRAPHVGRYYDPHGRCGRAPIPIPADKRLFRDEGLPNPPSFNEANISDKPSFLSGAPKVGPVERRKIRKHWRCALASLRGVDRGVEKIYDAVKDAGELRRTVFIFTSDNGLFHGQHRLRKRQGPSLRGGPAHAAVDQGAEALPGRRLAGEEGRQAGWEHRPGPDDPGPRRCPAMFGSGGLPNHGRTLPDALAEALGPLATPAGPAHRVQGGTTRDVMRPASSPGSGRATSIYVRHSRVVDPSTSQCIPDDERERYNLKKDPFQLRNLCFGGSAGNCPAGEKQLDLELRLNQLRDCAGVTGRDARVGARPFCE